jgi:lyso-ornithine lipid O-acyltransferase
MGFLLASARFVLFVSATLYYIIRLVLMNVFLGFKLNNAVMIPKLWSRAMLSILNIKVEVEGNIPEGKFLFLPNHRSYLDGCITCAQLFCSYVMKAEVGKWPLIGWGTKITGTIMVNRSNRDSRKETREKVKQRLADGYSVVVFPEGTTYEGPGCLEFKPGMFQIAAEGNIPIVPIAIEYEVVSDAWTGSDTFIPHFFKCFSKPVTHVKMRIGNVLENSNAELLQSQAHGWISEKLIEMRNEFESEKLVSASVIE